MSDEQNQDEKILDIMRDPEKYPDHLDDIVDYFMGLHKKIVEEDRKPKRTRVRGKKKKDAED